MFKQSMASTKDISRQRHLLSIQICMRICKSDLRSSLSRSTWYLDKTGFSTFDKSVAQQLQKWGNINLHTHFTQKISEVVPSQQSGRFFSNFVAFSEYLHFKEQVLFENTLKLLQHTYVKQ